jgi:ABC-2 type transport system permease protein
VNATYLRIDLVRQLRDVMNIAFAIGLPVVMYIVFGSTFASGDDAVGHGNARFYVLSAMAAYGACVAATSVTGSAAIEQMQGWGRQLALTPMRPRAFVVTKVVDAMVVSCAAVAAVFVVGLATGAKADPPVRWVTTFVVAWLGSALFALYGLVVAQLFRSESAIGVGAASLVLFAFFGNLFVPLSGGVLAVARWTPMYGYAGLARYPQMEGQLLQTSAATPPTDPLWVLVVNYVAWVVVFAVIATWAVRRGRRRQ